MYYDDEAPEFWSDEPTRPLERIRSRLSPAGNPPVAPSRPYSPPAGGRSHTGEIPLVPARRRGTSRPGAATRTGTGTRTGLAGTSWSDLTSRVRDAAQQLKPRPRSHGPYDFQADDYSSPAADTRRGTGSSDQFDPADDNGRPTRGLTTGPARSLGGIDPLMRRLGSLVLIIALATPVALMMRSGDAEGQGLRPDDSTLITAQITDPTVAATDTVAPTDPATVAAVTAAVTVTAAPTPAPTVTTAAPATTAARVAPTTAAPKVCTSGYKVVRGDSWSRIAQKVGVATGDMLDANNATAKTLLLPGKVVCMPRGATNTTVAPPTTKPKPTPTTKPKSTPTTVKPPAVRPTYTRDEVIQMIRDIWPDHLEAHAIEIANRESRFNPYSANSCCYGVFQINYNAHKKWLPTIGVTNAAQLFDPRVNITAAYVVYQRSNSFAPWGG